MKDALAGKEVKIVVLVKPDVSKERGDLSVMVHLALADDTEVPAMAIVTGVLSDLPALIGSAWSAYGATPVVEVVEDDDAGTVLDTAEYVDYGDDMY